MPATFPMTVTPFEHCRYWVSSEKDPAVRYLVDLLVPQCDCTNFRVKVAKDPNYSCKHCRAALPVFALEMLEDIRRKMRNT